MRYSPKLKPLIWIYNDSERHAASTIMRGQQLSEMAASHISPDLQVEYREAGSVGDTSGSIIIMTKGALRHLELEQLEQLKARDNIVCGDFVDLPIRQELVACLDSLIASSIKQYIDFSSTYPEKFVHLITHHTDPEIDDFSPFTSYCNIGYFGEISNAAYSLELQGIIDFNQINTRYLDRKWIKKLETCNVHYAVRYKRHVDGYKPFLKGFTAARCQSNIIVQESESDALYYLTPEYPYLLKSDKLSDVRDMIYNVQESFQGEEWFRALEIMEDVAERTSVRHIMGEIRNLLRILS